MPPNETTPEERLDAEYLVCGLWMLGANVCKVTHALDIIDLQYALLGASVPESFSKRKSHNID